MHKTMATLAVLTIGALTTPGSAASAACPELPVYQRFAPWGDDAYYEEVPGGSFDEALSWTAVGAPELVENAHPLDGSSAVRLRGGESITSPVLCVSKLHPHLRFLARAADGKSRLKIEVLWSDQDGRHERKPLSVAQEHAKHYQSWTPTSDVGLKKVLPKGLEDVRDIQLRFSVREESGDWLVDDVFVDPFKRG